MTVYPYPPSLVGVASTQADPFDARVLADFLRTDHGHLPTLQPSSEAAQELKLLTEDYQRQIRQQTRLVNQLTNTLKAYYPWALDIAELTTALARDFLQAYPTPDAVTALTAPVAAVGSSPSAKRSPNPSALGSPPAAAAAGAGPRGAGQGPVDAEPGRAADTGGRGRRGLPEGGRGFFRQHAGGAVGPDAPDR
jgi:Transposase